MIKCKTTQVYHTARGCEKYPAIKAKKLKKKTRFLSKQKKTKTKSREIQIT